MQVRNRAFGHPLARVIDESLGTVLSPARRDRVIAEALDAAGLEAIPEQARAVRAFIAQDLTVALAGHVGAEDATEIRDQVLAALAFADDEPISEVHACLLPAQRVIVATRASLVAFLLRDAVGDAIDVGVVQDVTELATAIAAIDVGVVQDVTELATAIAASSGARLLVVIDRRQGFGDVRSLVELLAGLDGTCSVVWWGATAIEHAHVRGGLSGGPRVLACGFDVRLTDLGDLCNRLVRAE